MDIEDLSDEGLIERTGIFPLNLERHDILEELVRRYNNKKNECERLRTEMGALRAQFPRMTDWEWFFRPLSQT